MSTSLQSNVEQTTPPMPDSGCETSSTYNVGVDQATSPTTDLAVPIRTPRRFYNPWTNEVSRNKRRMYVGNILVLVFVLPCLVWCAADLNPDRVLAMARQAKFCSFGHLSHVQVAQGVIDIVEVEEAEAAAGASTPTRATPGANALSLAGDVERADIEDAIEMGANLPGSGDSSRLRYGVQPMPLGPTPLTLTSNPDQATSPFAHHFKRFNNTYKWIVVMDP